MQIKKGWAMAGSCLVAAHGLQRAHAYTILGAVELKVTRKGKLETVKLLKLRNPYSKERYRGEWRDNDPQWTDELRKQVGSVHNKRDGIFFITLESFKHGVPIYTVNMYQDWKISQVKVKKKL